MAQVREEVVRRGGSLPVTTAAPAASVAKPLSTLARWQPSAPRIPVKREYVLPELLSFSDRDFVEIAYRALLRRAPDDAGLDHHLSLLRNGRASKVEILAALRWSAEGEKEGVHVDGLLAPYLLQKWRRKRLVGPVIGWLQAITRLPQLFERQSVLDAAHAREAQELGRTLNLQAEQIEQRLAAIEGLSRRLDTVTSRLDGLPDVVPAIRLMAERLDELTRRDDELSLRHDELSLRHEELARRDDELSLKHEELARRDDELSLRHEELTRRDDELSLRHDELARKDDELLQRDEQLREELRESSDAIRILAEDMHGHAQHALELGSQLDGGSRHTHKVAADLQPLLVQLAEARESRLEVDGLLAAFEDAFHGDRLAVRSVYEPYLVLLNNFGIGNLDAPVFDLASGRGEWLELLKEQQLVGQGVDANRLFAESCQGRGLLVEAGDAVEALAARANDSLGAVTLMRAAGNVPLDRMVKILDQSVRVLRPGGLIMLHGFDPKAKYLGMSGERGYHPPLAPDVVRWLLEARGFYAARIAHPDPAAPTTQHYDGSALAGVELVRAPPPAIGDSPWECAVIARKLL